MADDQCESDKRRADEDTGKVDVEWIVGRGPRESYGKSVVQLGRPKQIYWLGAKFEDREGYCDTNRSRYAQTSPFITEAGDDDFETGIVKPKTSRVASIEMVDPDNPKSSRLKVILESGEVVDNLDIVIDATPAKSTIEKLFQPNEMSYPVLVGDGFDTIQVAKRYGRDIYIIGPAAQSPLTDREKQTFPSVIRENTAAAWANSKRSSLFSERLARELFIANYKVAA